MEEVRLLNALLDVNLLLDVFLEREPWVAEAKELWTAHHRRGYVGTSPLTVSRTYSTSRKIIGLEKRTIPCALPPNFRCHPCRSSRTRVGRLPARERHRRQFGPGVCFRPGARCDRNAQIQRASGIARSQSVHRPNSWLCSRRASNCIRSWDAFREGEAPSEPPPDAGSDGASPSLDTSQLEVEFGSLRELDCPVHAIEEVILRCPHCSPAGQGGQQNAVEVTTGRASGTAVYRPVGSTMNTTRVISRCRLPRRPRPPRCALPWPADRRAVAPTNSHRSTAPNRPKHLRRYGRGRPRRGVGPGSHHHLVGAADDVPGAGRQEPLRGCVTRTTGPRSSIER